MEGANARQQVEYYLEAEEVVRQRPEGLKAELTSNSCTAANPLKSQSVLIYEAAIPTKVDTVLRFHFQWR